MNFFKPKTTYIDRLIPTRVSEQNIFDKALKVAGKKLLPYPINPILEESLFLKDLERRVLTLGLDFEKFKIIKALFTSLGFTLGLFIVALGFSFQIIFVIPTLLIMALIGFSLPDFFILDKENYRDYKIHTELPSLLDLLYLYAASAAYESFGQALFEISQTMPGVLAKELTELTSMYRFVSLDDFLDGLEKRFPDQIVKDLTTTVRLTEKYGGSFSKKISILSEEAHKTRLQRAREIGQRSSVALLVPLLLFHLPVAMIIFMAPMVLSLRTLFGT